MTNLQQDEGRTLSAGYNLLGTGVAWWDKGRYYLCSSRAKKTQNCEELSKRRTCKNVTQKAETSRSITQPHLMAQRETPGAETALPRDSAPHVCRGDRLPVLPDDDTPSAMEQCRRQPQEVRTWLSLLIGSPEPAAALSPASSASAGQHSEKKGTLGLWV